MEKLALYISTHIYNMRRSLTYVCIFVIFTFELSMCIWVLDESEPCCTHWKSVNTLSLLFEYHDRLYSDHPNNIFNFDNAIYR